MDFTLDEIKDYINRLDRFSRHNGMQLVTLRTGYAEAEMEMTENTLNGFDLAQGGAIFTLADLALAGAANSHGIHALAMNSTIAYVRPGVKGKLRAIGREINRGKRTGLYEIEVRNDQDKLVAKVTSTAFYLETRFTH